MRRVLLVWILALPLAWPVPDKSEKRATEKRATEKGRAATQSITGCVDQQGETYVLRELTAARTVTSLRGKSFSDDNFARYVGHKVTVHGSMRKEGSTSVMDVTKINDAGPGCSTQ